jgi:hypothetical protein
MTLQRVLSSDSPPLAIPSIPRISRSPSFASLLLDASGEKVAFIGHFWNKDGTTKNISKVHFSTRSVTFNVASVLTVSLQDRSSTGNPVRPDETPDQSATFTGVALTANSYLSATLGASRSTAYGAVVCAVFDITTFNASDAVNIGCSQHADSDRFHLPCASHKTGGSWGATNNLPNIVFECDDGTFGTLQGAFVWSAAGSITAYNTGSTPDEQAIRIVPKVDMKVDGVWGVIQLVTASSTADWVLYDSSGGVLGTISLTQADMIEVSTPRYGEWMFSTEIELAAGSTYYLALKATTASANNIGFNYIDVAAAGHMTTKGGGTDSYLCTRTDAAAWPGTETTTRRPHFGLTISMLDDGAGGGGGTTIAGTPMLRGMIS